MASAARSKADASSAVRACAGNRVIMLARIAATRPSRHIQRSSDRRCDAGSTGAGIEHKAEWPTIVDIHRRPDASNLIAPCGRDVAWLERSDHDFSENVCRGLKIE